tara:strand:+ start:748 stop:2337 length:1590 start_codon:yes stop_codon:yes gene_type:complete
MPNYTVDQDRIQKDYYEGNSYGDYQFTSLQDIINQFLVVYVGEGKIINKVSKTDVAFHAQRALQELSFDTFKSVKAQEIILPPSLQMILPHDYINYTNLSWSDASGIQHTIYPTSKTSNPFSVNQDADGNYDFSGNAGGFSNFNNNFFTTPLSAATDWVATNARVTPHLDDQGNVNERNPNGVTTIDFFNSSSGGNLKATIHKETFTNNQNTLFTFGRHYSCWQAVDVNDIDEINLSGLGEAPADITGASGAIVRLGISSSPGDIVTHPHKDRGPSLNGQTTGIVHPTRGAFGPSFIHYDGSLDNKAYMQWTGGAVLDNRVQSMNGIDVSGYNEVFVLVTMFVPGNLSGMVNNTNVTLRLDNVKLSWEGSFNSLQQSSESTTWKNYKAANPSTNENKEYDSQNRDLSVGQRYGLDPQHSQSNGSFYIDNLKGLIHFSSNISGKTVILKYISDSLGTDNEMQVHKLAQEALYKHIMYSVLSTKAGVPEYVVRRYKQEKFASTRQAKLRLSNIKLEEITQILRGKSKLIKH